MNMRFVFIFSASILCAVSCAAQKWDAGMDDDAGKAAATSRGDLPGADYEGAQKLI